MLPNQANLSSAIEDFYQARRRAALKTVLARLTGQTVDLLSFDAVSRQLKASGSAERGLQEIPLNAIAGSVGRPGDFTRDFLPRTDQVSERWARIRLMVQDPSGSGLPPISVYQIGDAYFVIDGHHRVSVARQLGATHIQAYVTEVRTRVPLSADVDPSELILKAEYAEFLEATQLDLSRPGADLSVSIPGHAAALTEHVRVYQAQNPRPDGSLLPLPEAAALWYDEVYTPVVAVIREQGLLRDFPGHTEADLYLLVSEHRSALEAALGWRIDATAGAASLAQQRAARRRPAVLRAGRRLLDVVVPDELRDGPAVGQWRRERLAARYADRLFREILVAMGAEPAAWQGLEEALNIARRERANVLGLHVVGSEAERNGPAVAALRRHFDERLQALGLTGSLAVETGEVARCICERAAVADLVVLQLAHPPASQPLARLGSGFRAVLRRCPRPVLAAPAARERVERVLLGYDGSAKAEEALFVATYLAEAWKARLAVVCVIENDGVAETLPHARAYLELHEVEAEFITPDHGPAADAILQAAEARDSDLIVLGGYGATPVVEVVLGSTVDRVLRETRRPVLVCR